MESLKRIVQEQPFFKGLDERWLELITGCAKNLVVKPGDFLFREGEAADEFYLLREGRVALETHVPRHEPLVIETLARGEIIGWSWLVPPFRWSFDAFVQTPARLLVFDGSCLRKKMEANPELGYELFRRFMPVTVARLQATRLRLLDVYGNPHASPSFDVQAAKAAPQPPRPQP